MARARVSAAWALALIAAVILAPTASALYDPRSPVRVLTASSLNKFLDQRGVALVEFFAPWCGHCKSLKPEWEKAAKALRGLVPVVAVDADAEREAAQEHRVQGFPTIKLLARDEAGGKVVAATYQGPREAPAVVQWALEKAGKLAQRRLRSKKGKARGGADEDRGARKGKGKARRGAEEDEQPRRKKEDEERELKRRAQREHEEEDEGTCASPEAGEDASPSCGETSAEAPAEASASASASASSSSSTSTFYARHPGVAVLPAANLSSYLRSPSEASRAHLVEFFAPWCEHSKAFKRDWVDLATARLPALGVAPLAVDCEAPQGACDDMDVRKLPTLRFFPAQDAATEGARREETAAAEDVKAEDVKAGAEVEKARSSDDFITYVDHPGSRDVESVLAFVREQVQSYARPEHVTEIDGPEAWARGCVGSGAETDAPDAATASPGAAVTAAVAPKSLCVVAFLPSLLDGGGAAGRNASIELLAKLARTSRGRPYGFLWAEGGTQPALEAALDVGGAGYPAAVALAPGKALQARLRGAFDDEHLGAFFDAVRGGRKRLERARGLDVLRALDLRARPAWAGEEAVEDAQDEFSLEDIMREEL